MVQTNQLDNDILLIKFARIESDFDLILGCPEQPTAGMYYNNLLNLYWTAIIDHTAQFKLDAYVRYMCILVELLERFV